MNNVSTAPKTISFAVGVRNKVKGYIAAGIVTVAVGVGIWQAGTPTPPPPPSGVSGNIWVDTSGGSCADSSLLINYPNNGTECADLNSAVIQAEPGDTIAVRAGAYPYQTINFRASLKNLSPGCDPYGEWGTATTVNCVEIVPDGDVKIRGLTNRSSAVWINAPVENLDAGTGSVAAFNQREYLFHVTNTDLIGNPPPLADDDAQCNCASAQFQLVRAASADNESQNPDHVVAHGVDADTMSIYGGDNIMAKNIDVGPMWYDTPNRGSSSGSSPDVVRIWNRGATIAPENIVWDGVFVHEGNRTFWCDVNNACHNDGLYITNGGPIDIRNSGFSQVAGQQLFFENFGGDSPATHDFTMENTWIGCVVNSYPDNPMSARTTCGTSESIDIKNCGSTCSNFLIRYSAWYGLVGAETSFSNVRFVGNAGRQPPNNQLCTTGVTFSYNAWFTSLNSVDCGATNINTGSSSPGSLFVNVTPGSEDFHLITGNTVADNLVSPTTSDFLLNIDADLQSRPQGANRDAGIDER